MRLDGLAEAPEPQATHCQHAHLLACQGPEPQHQARYGSESVCTGTSLPFSGSQSQQQQGLTWGCHRPGPRSCRTKALAPVITASSKVHIKQSEDAVLEASVRSRPPGGDDSCVPSEQSPDPALQDKGREKGKGVYVRTSDLPCNEAAVQQC